MSRTEWQIAHEDDPRPEEAWYGRSLDELADLSERIEATGASRPFAASLVGNLVRGTFDGLSPNTQANYRRILRELGPPPRAGRPRGARAASGRAARSSMQLVGAAGARGVSVLASTEAGCTGLSLAADASPPIILDPPGADAHTAAEGPFELVGLSKAA